jgi:hypothetical protein
MARDRASAMIVFRFEHAPQRPWKATTRTEPASRWNAACTLAGGILILRAMQSHADALPKLQQDGCDCGSSVHRATDHTTSAGTNFLVVVSGSVSAPLPPLHGTQDGVHEPSMIDRLPQVGEEA